MPSDDIPLRMLVLLLELLKSGELPELAVGGAWFGVSTLMLRGSAALGTVALEAACADVVGRATQRRRDFTEGRPRPQHLVNGLGGGAGLRPERLVQHFPTP